MSATTIDHHSALIYAMVLVSASDSQMRDNEMRRIGEIVRRLPAFRDFDENDLPDVARQCATMLALEDGLNTVLTVIDQALPPKLKELAYALAWEVAAVDMRLGAEERRLIELLRQALGLDTLAAGAIEHACRVRHASI